MKKFTKQILGHVVAISTGALAGFSLVHWYITTNSFWLILTIPGILSVSHSIYGIRKATKNIKRIEKEFKDKHGFDIWDKEALEKYLDEIGKIKQ